MNLRDDAPAMEALLAAYDAGEICLFPGTLCTASPHVKYYPGADGVVNALFPQFQDDLEAQRPAGDYNLLMSRIFPTVGIFQISNMFPMMPVKTITDRSIELVTSRFEGRAVNLFFPPLLGNGMALNIFNINFDFPASVNVTVWATDY